MKVFIAGIGGAFMGGVAQLAEACGYTVRGCDAGVYPPMSEVLRASGIEVMHGYLPEHLGDNPGTVLIGNALSRGNALVEDVLNRRLPFQSGPEWLRDNVLTGRSVINVAGTHGKTTTSSILAWILHRAGCRPGYLIGGKPGNFNHSAALGEGEHFVIEADEYDTAFFDKRAKFVHYRPHIAVLNNLEFDHADIYDDLKQIQKQFHHLVRIVPGDGCVVVNADDPRLGEVMAMGCWSRVVRFSVTDDADAEWRGVAVRDDCARFEVLRDRQTVAQVEWPCIGRHNMQNALAAVAAAAEVGVEPAVAGDCLRDYLPAARRLQLLFESDAARLYDDFAHHPSAIRHTIAALRARHPGSRVIAVVELRSNSMKMGVHGGALGEALALADCALVCGGETALDGGIVCFDSADDILAAITSRIKRNDVIVTMSNGGFDNLPRRLAEALATL